MKKKTIIICFVLSAVTSLSQTFEVDQIEQLFRPRARVDSKYIFDSPFRDTSSVFSQLEGNAVFTFPIKTKIETDIKLDLKSTKLKDILQNSIRIKASQTLGMFRINTRQVNIGFDSLPRKNIVNATAGILGVRLTKKYRVVFYSINASFAEQDITFNAPGLRASALLGQLHLRGLKRNFFYGVAATYSDGLLLPAAFFGGSEPIGRKFIFNYTLPVQINLQYKDNKRTLITVGVNGDGYRTGIHYKTKRLNVNYTSASVFLNLRYKFTKNLLARIEGGYVFYQNWRYTPVDNYKTNFNIGPGPYVQAGFNILFGKTIWEKLAMELFKN